MNMPILPVLSSWNVLLPDILVAPLQTPFIPCLEEPQLTIHLICTPAPRGTSKSSLPVSLSIDSCIFSHSIYHLCYHYIPYYVIDFIMLIFPLSVIMYPSPWECKLHKEKGFLYDFFFVTEIFPVPRTVLDLEKCSINNCHKCKGGLLTISNSMHLRFNKNEGEWVPFGLVNRMPQQTIMLRSSQNTWVELQALPFFSHVASLHVP